MAGVNQHNIPQFLSRGFRVPDGSDKKDSTTWLYEKGIPPRQLSIRYEVGVEPHFYSEPSTDGSRTLDDEITDYEDAAARRLNALKNAATGTKVNADTAAELVAHLTIRNAHLRRTFTLGVTKLVGRAVDVFCDEATLRPILGVDGKVASQAVKDFIDEQLKNNPALAASGLPAHVLHQIAQMLLKERFKTFFAEAVPVIAATFGYLNTEAPAFVRDGHNKALSTSIVPDRRVEMLKALRWRVLPTTGDGFVLPDCVALADDDGSGLKPLIVADLDKIITVLMPLSTDRMLVGVGPSATAPDLLGFNHAAAAASHAFFIAARFDDKLASLSERISQSSGWFIGETVGSVFDDFLSTRGVPALPANGDLSRDASAAAEDGPESPPPTAPNYTVHFHSCAEHAIAEKIAATVNTITANVVPMMPLDRLDGVTFSGNYTASLRDLDRGFPASAPLQPTNEEYGVGVAMAPLVMRDGIIKTHIVMQGGIGHALISEDEASWRLALHTVVRQLAHAACAQIVDESLPGVLLRRFDDRYDGFLYGAIHSAWTGYFSARASAVFYPEGGLPHEELLLAVLKRARSDIPSARLAYRFDGDMDKLLAVAMPRIEDVLRFSGTVLDHSDGLEQSILDNQILAVALEEAGLRDWIVLFDNDLSQLWDRRRQWASFDEFLELNRHVERLLWQYGLFPWRNDAGLIQIAVPLATDANKLVGSRSRLRRIATTTWRRLKGLLV